MFGNFGELLDLHTSHRIFGTEVTEEEENVEEEEEVRLCVIMRGRRGGGQGGHW